MKTQEIRNEIIKTLSGIPDIGKIQPFERYAREPATLKNFYIKEKELCGWYVRRTSVREEAWTSGRNKVFQDWQIVGFMGLSDADASEILFNAKIDAIRRAFRTCALQSADETGEVQVSAIQPVMFCGILCHTAELTLQTVSYVEIEADQNFDLTDFLLCKTDYDAGLTAEDMIELGGTNASKN